MYVSLERDGRGVMFGLKDGLCVQEGPAKPSKLSEVPVIKVTSCLTFLFKQKELHSRNKQSLHC